MKRFIIKYFNIINIFKKKIRETNIKVLKCINEYAILYARKIIVLRKMITVAANNN
jgi:hypothetical protein